MGELMRPLEGVLPMMIIVCIETLVIMIAMAVDFFSGYYKAKLRGEVRNSMGMKRTVSKFILYIGSVMIASGVDLIFFICGFWGIIRFSALSSVPVVTTVVSIFICAIEIRSVWEKAERKQKRDALQTAEAVVALLGK
jgi:phage-related holin